MHFTHKTRPISILGHSFTDSQISQRPEKTLLYQPPLKTAYANQPPQPFDFLLHREQVSTISLRFPHTFIYIHKNTTHRFCMMKFPSLFAVSTRAPASSLYRDADESEVFLGCLIAIEPFTFLNKHYLPKLSVADVLTGIQV